MSHPSPLARRAPLSLLLALTLGSQVALAEPRQHPRPSGTPPKAALDEAKALYVAGNRAVEQGRWADALADFEKSYSLSGVAAALFNVATALRALGRHVEARDAFAQLLSDHKSLDPDVKSKAESMLAGEKARVAALLLAGLPPPKPELRLSLDGSTTKDDGSRPFALELDPGKHSLQVSDAGSKPFTWEGVLADGEKKTVTVRLEPAEQAKPAPVEPRPAAPPPPAESSGGILSSPIFWGVVGVVVIGGAAAGGYFWHQGRQLDAGSGTVVKL